MEYLITFESTAHAIKAESILLNEKIELKIKPLPNELSSGCGISIVFKDLDKVKKIIESNKIKYGRLYKHDGVYKQIEL